MKILCHTHTYYPTPHSGADIYAERLMTWLANNGCEVKVITDNQAALIQCKNHTVETNKFRIAENYEWCDCVVTNLVTNNQAIWLSERFKKPIFHICHNATMPSIQPSPLTHIIYNSYWLAQTRPLPFPSVVVQPVTWIKDWKSRSGNCITLINCTANKGAELFHQIAVHMPQFNFMRVKGRYGSQYGAMNKNITDEPFTNNVQSVYDKTALLLVPSKAESWSLCAAEAQCCGIPVICNNLPGLRENLKDSAVYVSGTRQYMDAITGFLWRPDFYNRYVELGLANQRANEKNHILQLENLLSFMKEKVKKDEREKVSCETLPEKVMKQPTKEKKIINKPSTPK